MQAAIPIYQVLFGNYKSRAPLTNIIDSPDFLLIGASINLMKPFHIPFFSDVHPDRKEQAGNQKHSRNLT